MLALVVFCVSLPILYIAGGAYTEALPRLFDSSTWKSADIGAGTRCSMLLDLRLRIGVERKTRRELIALLGPDVSNGPARNFGYWLLCPSFMDVWILEVRWKDDVAVDAWVRDT